MKMEVNSMFPFLISIIILPCTIRGHQGEDYWFGVRQLDSNYLFKWKHNETSKVLTIRLEVITKGWLGFGFSSHGKMGRVHITPTRLTLIHLTLTRLTLVHLTPIHLTPTHFTPIHLTLIHLTPNSFDPEII